ncbi:MAG: monovalent cation/H+ antiporter subunit D family protein [Pseudomonadota bacterium]
MTGETLLQLALGIPVLGAFGIALTGFNRNLREAVTLLTAGALFVVVVLNILPMVQDGARPAWLALTAFGVIDIAFKVEPLGMLFACIASSLWIVNSVYSIGYMRGNNEPRQTQFYVCFAVAIASAMGIAFAGNLFTLFLFYEILTVSTYPLVAHKGNQDARSKARIYIVLLMVTSMVLLLPAIIWTWVAAGTSDFTAGGILAGAGLSAGALATLYALYAFGIGKAALMPVHFWLPAAMVAPTPVSALLHAVAVVKAGVFSVVKITTYVFGIDLLAETGASDPILYVAGFTVICASLIALNQDNLKKRLAFSTVSQLSYVVMAAALATPAAIIGAALHIAAHAVSKITLFFAAGSIYTAAHLTEVSQMDGLARRQPWTFCAFLVGALSIIGLPPFIGLWSKWWIGVGAAEGGELWVIAVLMISSLLNVAYMLPIIARGWFVPSGPSDTGAAPAIHEAPIPVVAALTVTAILCVVLFFGIEPLLALTQQIEIAAPESIPASVEGGQDG